jgi:hydroxyacylglutathione hydrolase
MKKLFLATAILISSCLSTFAQMPSAQIGGKEVFKNDDVVFHQIDDHTWVGTGHMMAESLYLVEGSNKALLIDAGTNIKDLDKIVGSITKKPVTLVATHVHPDHTGASIDVFPEILINPGDTVNIPRMMPTYKGTVKFLKDGQIFDLGGRTLEVVFTPAHILLVPHHL